MARWVVPMTRVGVAAAIGALALFVSGAIFPQSPPQGAATAPDTSQYDAPVDVDTAGLPGPRQPIFFRHDVHAGQYKIDCKYCHAYVERGPNPGMPSTAACMGCHLIVGSGNPEVQKLRDAKAADKPLEWIQVHYLPPFVHFPHMEHVVKGGLDCKECHGQVDRMPQVYRFASLKMGWCISCHLEKEYEGHPGRHVTTDCSACHY